MLIFINFSFDFLDLKNIDFENYIVANEVIKLLHVLLEKISWFLSISWIFKMHIFRNIFYLNIYTLLALMKIRWTKNVSPPTVGSCPTPNFLEGKFSEKYEFGNSPPLFNILKKNFEDILTFRCTTNWNLS